MGLTRSQGGQRSEQMWDSPRPGWWHSQEAWALDGRRFVGKAGVRRQEREVRADHEGLFVFVPGDDDGGTLVELRPTSPSTLTSF